MVGGGLRPKEPRCFRDKKRDLEARVQLTFSLTRELYSRGHFILIVEPSVVTSERNGDLEW